MKNKPNLECVECNHLFYRSASVMLKSLTNGDDIQCPKCKGFDVEPAGVMTKTFTQLHTETFGVAK